MSKSFWMDQCPLRSTAVLTENLSTDICIIGGGIAGLTCAYRLLQEGKNVVILDDGPLCGGETSRTTAHLTNTLDDRYFILEQKFGPEGTTLAAQSHAAAIDFIERVSREEKIDCDFERVKAYLFVPPNESKDVLQKEIESAHRAGLNDVKWIDKAPFSTFDTGRALQFPHQAQFSPLKYLTRLIDIILKKGGKIFTQTHAHKIRGGSSCSVTTLQGYKIDCKSVIVATNSPVNSRFLIHTKQAPYRTYVIAGKIPKGYLEKALYYDTAHPYNYVRIVEKGNDTWLIMGGQDHRVGENKNPLDCYRILEEWTRERFPAFGEVAYRWSGQIIEPMDGLAFIGKFPLEKNIYVATGDSGNGLTHGTIAGMLITDLITDKPNPWEKLYDPSRISLKAVPTFIKENVNTAFQYGKWLTIEDSSCESIPCCSGAVINRGLNKVAVYRDENDQIHEFSAVCPHLGGPITWNSAEQSWDCPCHGSRFTALGEVINGPANESLKNLDLEKPDF